MILLVYILAGALAGFSAGLFGVGGGMVVVPALSFIFLVRGLDPDISMHLALGTSLATIIATGLSSMLAHNKRGNIIWPVFLKYAAGLGLGAALGGVIADQMSGEVLRLWFALFILLLAAQLAFAPEPKPTKAVPGWLGLGSAGTAIGALSSLIGIGGGAMTVPYLISRNVPTKVAVGISSAGGLPIAIFGTATFMVAGLNAENLPPNSIGYVYWPAFLGIVVTSIPAAKYGAKVASNVSDKLLKRSFAVFLVFVSVSMLLK